jgi:hypothetical protein
LNESLRVLREYASASLYLRASCQPLDVAVPA